MFPDPILFGVVTAAIEEETTDAYEEGYEAGIRAQVSQMWGDDWNSPEDSVYDD